jgi:hypothetical protein
MSRLIRLARLAIAPALAIGVLVGVAPGVSVPTAEAASCVRISGGRFDAPGNDNYSQYLNGEYIRIKNYCSGTKSLSGYRLHDYGRKHTYTFPSNFRLGAGNTVTVFSGRGTRTAAKLFWGRSYGAVWNNSAPERAYLRNSSATLLSSWSSF